MHDPVQLACLISILVRLHIFQYVSHAKLRPRHELGMRSCRDASSFPHCLISLPACLLLWAQKYTDPRTVNNLFVSMHILSLHCRVWSVVRIYSVLATIWIDFYDPAEACRSFQHDTGVEYNYFRFIVVGKFIAWESVGACSLTREWIKPNVAYLPMVNLVKYDHKIHWIPCTCR